MRAQPRPTTALTRALDALGEGATPGDDRAPVRAGGPRVGARPLATRELARALEPLA